MSTSTTARRAHDHDIDPSCRERIIDGRPVGECLAPPETRAARRVRFRPLPTPLDRLKAAARELRGLPAESRRLHAALGIVTTPDDLEERIDPAIASRLLGDATRIGTAILEHAELVGIELGEAAAHGYRYAADRDVAEAALGDIRHLTETAHERHSADTLSGIESILDEAGVQ